MIKPSPYQAVILDLDGVITKTSHLHALSWQKMFETYFPPGASQGLGFDIAKDYHLHMDGKPRCDGLRSFLKTRNLDLSPGDPDDPPELETLYGLGNRKNAIFLELLNQGGVEVYPDTVAQIHRWRDQGLKLAVVSSSRNCQPILEQVKLQPLFATKIDGVDAARLGLPGKPAPDIFLAAAQELNIEPQQAVVVEDAIAGVQAALAGQFGLVVGINRHGDEFGQSLARWADQVVTDLGELEF